MNLPLGEKSSFKSGLGYVCLLIFLVLLFYWEGLRAHLDSLDLETVRQAVDDLAPKWYFENTWKPVWFGLIHLAYLSFGFNPLPYHLMNLVLYISTLFVLYLFYNLFLENRVISKVAVLLFATFYLHAEAVNQLYSNRELLKTLFGITAVFYFFSYRKTHYLRYYILALLFCILSYLSDEASVCLPLLLLAVDYHISHNAFPPKLHLKDIERGLLLHLPFWFTALAVLSYTLFSPSGSVVFEWSRTRTFYDILYQSYFLAIYTFAPCYPSNKLTVLLGTIVMAGIGWLFYRSSSQGRSLILTMTACTGFSLAPYTIVGPAPRYIFFSSAFSMFLVALLTFEMARRIYGLLEERLQGYRLSAQHTVTTFTILILLPAIYLNFKDVRQYTRNALYAGRLVREIVEGTARFLPKGSDGAKVFYVNLPSTVKSDAILSQDVFIAHNSNYLAALNLYGRQHYIPKIDLELPWPSEDGNSRWPTLYLNLGYDRVPLDSRAWYSPVKVPAAVALSPAEFDVLSKDKKNKVLFFNPATNRLMDVSGWSYEHLKKSIVP